MKNEFTFFSDKETAETFDAVLQRLAIEPTSEATRLMAGSLYATLTSDGFDLGALNALAAPNSQALGKFFAVMMGKGLTEEERQGCALALKPYVDAILH